MCLLNSPQTFRSYEVRCEAVRQLEQNGLLQFNWDWMLSCTQNNGLGGYQAFKAFWEAGNRPDAMIAANANLALGAMRYLYEQHIRLPDAMSIVAYEDSSLSGYAIPPLTTVDIHKEEIGRRAATCLLERIRNPKKEIEKMKNDGVRVVVIAEKIGVHRATIYNELKRGGTPYRAEVAQKTI